MKIRVHGIADGKHSIEQTQDSQTIEYISHEFFDTAFLKGTLAKIGKLFAFDGQVKCNAHLICDLSLDEYDEEITANLSFSLKADTELFLITNGDNDSEEIIIHEEDEYFDMTELVRDALNMGLPMKRIAPQHKGKSFADLHQDLYKPKGEIDPRWASLKELKIDIE